MFILKSKAQIAKAIERAKAVHPKVRVKAFGTYEVTGSAGNLYTVRCERRHELKVVDCACVAGTFGTECFHAAAAIGQHMYLATTPLAQMSF
jgi:hypothetical protein